MTLYNANICVLKIFLFLHLREYQTEQQVHEHVPEE